MWLSAANSWAGGPVPCEASGQISLLVEHEVTRLVTLVSGIADRRGVETEADADLEEITQDVAPEAVLDELETSEAEASTEEGSRETRNRD